MTPLRELLGPLRARGLAHQGGQHEGRRVVADMTEGLERLVREVQRVALVDEDVIGDRRLHEALDIGERSSRVDRRREHTLGRILGARLDEAPVPVGQPIDIEVVGAQRFDREARCPTTRVSADERERVDECQRLVGGIEPVEDIGHRDERREPGTPSVGAVGAPELDAGAHDLGGRHRRFEQTLHGLCDHEREPLLEAVAKALLEPLDAIARVARMDDHGVARDLHVEALRVVGPGVERASRHQIEARVMPVAGEQPGLDRALVQGEPEMRATILDRERPSLVPEDHDGQRRRPCRADVLRAADRRATQPRQTS